jgi:hypothetical protein
MIYNAEYDEISELIRFLMEDCCSGRPEICSPAAACRTPEKEPGQ